jgi:KDO2-lipid IV(A) lauroyltransferase
MTKLENYASVLAVWSVLRVTGCLPWKGVQIFGRLLGELAYLSSRKYRRITLSNLKLAFGTGKEKSQLVGIARETYVNLGKGLCEALGSIHIAPNRMRKLVKLSGKENLDLALGSGKGVVAFSAHLGNFVLMGMRLAAEGYPFSFILREPESEQVARIFRYVAGQKGVGIISAMPRKKAIAESLKHLRRNRIVCILGDQRELHGGVSVDFFGHPAGTATGPVVLAMRTGASIVPMFSVREPGDSHTVVIEPAFKLVLSGDKEKDMYVNTAMLSKIVEGYIARYPSQWFWLHERWKKPKV